MDFLEPIIIQPLINSQPLIIHFVADVVPVLWRRGFDLHICSISLFKTNTENIARIKGATNMVF